ncbi:MAG: Ketopantoate reductase PanG [Myxococcaceae bacterium]|nr:Ketopantoate reductase PanG [Myxococcaceae bacterium]
MRVCVVGRGKVGRSLHGALRRAGVDSALIAGRAAERGARSVDVYLLAVPDAHIAEVARRLSGRVRAGAVVLHLAGARDARELSFLRERGAAVGVFHPLLSFARVATSKRGPRFEGATFSAFGDPAALKAAGKLAHKLAARVVFLEAAPGPAYHAAAALLANGAVALTQLGVRALLAVGFEQRQAERALSTLLASVADNVADLGVPSALTGPVARGDGDTVRAHVAALRRIDPKLAQHYAALQPAIVEAALAQGLAPERARQVLRALRPTRRDQATRSRRPRAPQVTK